MAHFKDINIGDQFNKLTVIEKRKPDLLVQCTCGTKKLLRCNSWLRVKSCGCLNKGLTSVSATHNHTKTVNGKSVRTPTYRIWTSMKGRCNCPTNKRYLDYGGRGISVCKEWNKNFEKFLRDMGEKPEGLTLERIDNNGNYAPGNCRWATYKEQNRNTRRNRYLELNGNKKILKEWAEELDINYRVLQDRVHKHMWSDEDALTVPVGSRRRKKHS